MNVPTRIFYKKICRGNDLYEPDERNLLNESEEDCGQNDELEDEIITNEASQIEPLQEILCEALGKQLHNTFFLKKDTSISFLKMILNFFIIFVNYTPLLYLSENKKK